MYVRSIIEVLFTLFLLKNDLPLQASIDARICVSMHHILCHEVDLYPNTPHLSTVSLHNSFIHLVARVMDQKLKERKRRRTKGIGLSSTCTLYGTSCCIFILNIKCRCQCYPRVVIAIPSCTHHSPGIV